MSFKLQVAASDPLHTKVDLLVFGSYEQTTPAALEKLESALGGSLKDLFARDEFKSKKDQKVILPTLGKLAASSLGFVGLGDKAKLTEASLRHFGAIVARAAGSERAESLAIVVPEGISGDQLRFLAEGVVLGAYRYDRYFTGARRPKKVLTRVTLIVPKSKSLAREQKAAALGVSIGEAINITRDLQNDPPNDQTPAALADAAVRVAREHKLKAQVFDMKKLQDLGMKLFVAVGQGSVNEPRMVHITYTPPRKAKRKVVLVGKGLTFDSGGLCIKPAQGMGEMKTDMSGAANVVGLMAAVALAGLDVEVHGILGCAENMPDGNAYRPGDIFGSLDGKTVEIINTDAEGRLVLADCLAYARSLKPDLIIDNATLTGACIVALGNTCSGFFATNDDLADSFASAAREAGEQFWRLPLLEDLKESLKSDVADLKHTGDRWGGSITAALFLREFVGEIPWIHCDIAGPSLSTRAYGIYPKGGTGHGVLTFLSFLEHFSLAMPQLDERARLERKLSRGMGRAIHEFSLIEPGDRILCAVSGGKDSYTLHHLLVELSHRSPVPFEVLAVNIDQGHPGYPGHILEGYMREKGHAFRMVHEDTYSVVTEKVPAGKTYCSLCSRLRRGILYSLARELKCTKIALGHHRDDAIVTLMLNLVFSGQLKSMPPKLMADDGENVVIRPLIFCAESEIARYSELTGFPILPCDLCGSQENLQRQVISRLLSDLEARNPGTRANMLAALSNVRPSHLLDSSLWKTLGLRVAIDPSEGSNEATLEASTPLPARSLVRPSA
jgi:leucyl aminopeptidase